MISLLLAVALSHEQVEQDLYARLQAAQETILFLPRPTKTMFRDWGAAHRCYVKFHRYKTEGCEAFFGKLEEDLRYAKPIPDPEKKAP
jgi:hypothetical protein